MGASRKEWRRGIRHDSSGMRTGQNRTLCTDANARVVSRSLFGTDSILMCWLGFCALEERHGCTFCLSATRGTWRHGTNQCRGLVFVVVISLYGSALTYIGAGGMWGGRTDWPVATTTRRGLCVVQKMLLNCFDLVEGFRCAKAVCTLVLSPGPDSRYTLFCRTLRCRQVLPAIFTR